VCILRLGNSDGAVFQIEPVRLSETGYFLGGQSVFVTGHFCNKSVVFSVFLG